jgi:hypothetical protein
MPKLLHDFVETRADSATIAEVNALAGIPRERRYRIDAEYDESEFHALLRAATRSLGDVPGRVADDFAEYVLEDFCRRWPAVFEMFSGARDLLEMLPHVYRAVASVLLEDEGDSPPPLLVCERRDRETVLYCGAEGAPKRFLSSFAGAVIRHFGDAATVERLQVSDRVGSGHAVLINWEEAPR